MCGRSSSSPYPPFSFPARSSTQFEFPNGLLDTEADQLCEAKRYEHSPERLDTRAGHYERQLQTKADEVTLQVPKLRKLPFESAIIERYRRRQISTSATLSPPRRETNETNRSPIFCRRHRD